ncbi:MAG: 30S ribosomal protein S8 [Candidatus Heimdallarchaeota archaeon]|nr:30S ribosomal protein S8 [Candidatus Heimdallarchaeota archaeon]
MTLLDPLADSLSKIEANEVVGKREVTVNPASKQIAATLRVMQKAGYVGEFEFIDDGGAGKFNVQLLGRSNKCRVVKPRFSVGTKDFERWEKQFLPAKGFGIIIITTTQGFMSHEEAKQNHIGGKLVAYVY